MTNTLLFSKETNAMHPKTRSTITLLCALLLAFGLSLSPSSASADAPSTFTHQGRVVHNESPYNGTMDITFKFFKEGASDPILTEEIGSVTFVDGFYTVQLGAETSNFLNTFVSEKPLELSVTIFPEDFKDGLTLEPRQRITSVPYAMLASSVSGGPVDATTLSVNGTSVVGNDGQWTGPAIPASKIANESITPEKVRNGAVTTDKLADKSVTSTKLADNSVHSGIIMDNGVSSADIQDDSVTSNDIQNNSIKQPDVQRGGGVYAYKSDVYSTRQTFNASSGVVSTQEASCQDANDLPLTGTCTAPPSSSAQLISTDAIDWNDETRPAAWRCAFSNPGSAVNVEAQILCVRVP